MQQAQYVLPSLPTERVRGASSNTSPYPFGAAELDYQAGGWSINALSKKHGIPEPTLRRHAKRFGWVSPTGTEVKRAMVREALASGLAPRFVADLTNECVNRPDEADEPDEARQATLGEAEQDVADMRLGLHLARTCMAKLLRLAAVVELPKDVKTIMEANKLAVDTIRKIRNLDDEPVQPESSVAINITDGFSELRAAFQKRLEQRPGAINDENMPRPDDQGATQ